jgi:hypothetical protein
VLEDKQTVDDESTAVLESNQTFLNPSDILKSCKNCKFETYCEKELATHIQNVHEDSFQCEYCVFKTQ